MELEQRGGLYIVAGVVPPLPLLHDCITIRWLVGCWLPLAEVQTITATIIKLKERGSESERDRDRVNPTITKKSWRDS